MPRPTNRSASWASVQDDRPKVERSARATAVVDVSVAGNAVLAGETFVAPVSQLGDAVVHGLVVVEAIA